MNTPLPKAVQAQLEQAEALERELAQGSEAAQAQNPAEPIETPAAPAAEPVQQTPEFSQVDVTATPQFGELKHKYDSLWGRFAALERKNAELSGQLELALTKLTEAANRKPEPVAQQPEQLVTKKDEDDFGADLVGMARRAAREEISRHVGAIVGELRKEFGAVREQVGQVAERQEITEDRSFWGAVRSLVPDWDQVNDTAEWKIFLDTAPDFSTQTYRQLGLEAIALGDAQKVAKLVEVWRKTLPPPAEPTQKPAVNPELARQVAPSTTRSTAAPTGKKIWTRAEYEAAYDPRNSRMMTETERFALQGEADLAVAEGRVRWA